MRPGRVALLLVPVVLAAGLAWGLGLFQGPAPKEGLEPLVTDAGSRVPARAPVPPPELTAPVAAPTTAWTQRVGVADRAEGPPPARAGDAPWQRHLVEARSASGGAWTGADVLASLSERLYVRAGTAEDLEALRKQTLAPSPPADPLPLPMVVQRLEQAGWRVVVQDPVLLFTRATTGASAPRPPR